MLQVGSVKTLKIRGVVLPPRKVFVEGLSTQRRAELTKTSLLAPRRDPTYSSPAWELQGPQGTEPTGLGEGETAPSSH